MTKSPPTELADSNRPSAPPERSASLGDLVRLVAKSDDLSARRLVIVLAAGLGLVILANTGMQTVLNRWQGGFYDSIEGRDPAAFLREVTHYLAIAGTLLVLVVAQTYLGEKLKIALRRVLTDALLDNWLVPKRAYLLTFAGEGGTNPDQRIQDDARRLSELTADLGASLVQAGLLFVTFVGVLWVLSRQVGFPVGGEIVYVPGSMVLCAAGFALLGSWLTWRFGRPLVHFNADRYAREAELRLALVRVDEAAEGITLYGGEADERRAMSRHVDAVTDAMALLARGLAHLTWVTSGFGWLAMVVPIIAAAPGYFAGTLSLGGLMMVVGAFMQVQSSMRWFVDNYSRIADWQAALGRVKAIDEALAGLGNGGAGHLDYRDGAGDRLVMDKLVLAMPGGRAGLDQPTVTVAPGERVLIVGDPQSGKSMLFLALAGLWTRGSGSIAMPPREACMFMPERPYLPPGALGAVLAYPAAEARFPDDAMHDALMRAGVPHLASSLDRSDRWDRALSLEEQQSVAFARLFLQGPRWIFLDDAASALDRGREQRLYAEVDRRLPDAAVIGTSRHADTLGFYKRIVKVTREDRPTQPEPAPKCQPVVSSPTSAAPMPASPSSTS
jgi:putative ATP-binding cassette transporter